MKEIIKKQVIDTILNIINNSINENKIKTLYKKHLEKTHFIPMKYRIIGSILQSINIQFGYFVEKLIKNIIKLENNFEVIDFDKKSNINNCYILDKQETLIDQYIVDRQITKQGKLELNDAFDNLLMKIHEFNDANNITNSKLNHYKHDVDLLFQNKTTGQIYYVEVKYNDDHDSGKFVDINRKFIKTYAYLIHKYKPSNYEKIKPIIFYFTNKIMKGNIYVPEQTHILRGEQFFDEFLSIKYNELEEIIASISNDKEIIDIFDKAINQILQNHS